MTPFLYIFYAESIFNEFSMCAALLPHWPESLILNTNQNISERRTSASLTNTSFYLLRPVLLSNSSSHTINVVLQKKGRIGLASIEQLL